MGEAVLALGYVVIYALGALVWYADDAPLSIIVIPLSPFVFPCYFAWGAMDPSPQRQQRQQRRPRDRNRRDQQPDPDSHDRPDYEPEGIDLDPTGLR